MEDYPSVRAKPETAALEIDRLTAESRIFWYADTVPRELDVGPTTLIEKSSRLRLVHDWTRAGLNSHIAVSATKSATMDTLLSAVRPNACIAGLDVCD